MKHLPSTQMIASQTAAILSMFAVLLVLLAAAMAATGEMGFARMAALPGFVVAALAFLAHRRTLPR